MDFLELAHARFSCRKFQDKKVEQEKIDKIIEAALASPTACNFQPFKIWVIENSKILNEMKNVTPYIFGTKTVMAIGADTKNAYVRKFDGKNFAQIDASIVATHMLLEIQNLGLGTTWVGYFEENKLKELIPEMADYDIIGLFPLGYPADNAPVAPMHYQSKSADEIVVHVQ